MADYTCTTNMGLEACITAGPMTNGDNLTINNGAIVTMTQTNSVLIGWIEINDGEFFIDGTNISSGNVISFVEEWDHNVNSNAHGVYRITGDWYDLGTTDGTDSQTFSLSTYYGGNFECVVNGIWVETGRRIDFDNASGTTPLVDDWVYKVSDKDILGRIVEVQSTYLVVKFLTGTLANNDNLEVVKIVENSNGPDYEVTWTADVNNASGDIQEDGVYQEFGNTVWDETSYINDFGDKMSGFVFAHLPETTTLTMGHATNGGFVPPSGCNVRIPNVNCTASNTTNFPLGTVYNDRGSTYSVRPGCYADLAGEIRLNKVNLGGVCYANTNPSVFEAYYVASNTAFGYNEVASKVDIQNNICTSDCWGGNLGAYDYFRMVDCLSGISIVDSIMVTSYIRFQSWRIENSVDVDITGNILLYGSTAVAAAPKGISPSYCKDVIIDNNVIYQGGGASYISNGVSISGCSDVLITNTKISGSIKGTQGTAEYPSMSLSRCNDTVIKGVEILEGAMCGDSLIYLTDCQDIDIRCIGMIDRKTTFTNSDFEYVVGATGFNININVARAWTNNNSAAYYGVLQTNNTNKDFLVQNCSSGYTTAFRPQQWDNGSLRGLHGGNGTPGSTDGIDDIYPASYGWAIHDGFRSDTVGFIVCLMIPDTTNTSSSVTIIAGDPLIQKDGTLDMVSGDIIEFEQHYFALGHTGFPGTYTSTVGTSAWNANEWTNITVEFQYDTSTGWNGSWLNARTSTNWTGITDTTDGVKLKYRYTATGTQTTMTMFIVDTTTTIAAQKANQYPIDQVSCDVVLNGIVVDSRWWIYDSDTDIELADGTATADPVTQNVVVPDATNLLIRVRKSSASVKYKPLITTAITNTTEINVAIIQQVDEIAT